MTIDHPVPPDEPDLNEQLDQAQIARWANPAIGDGVADRRAGLRRRGGRSMVADASVPKSRGSNDKPATIPGTPRRAPNDGAISGGIGCQGGERRPRE